MEWAVFVSRQIDDICLQQLGRALDDAMLKLFVDPAQRLFCWPDWVDGLQHPAPERNPGVNPDEDDQQDADHGIGYQKLGIQLQKSHSSTSAIMGQKGTGVN